MIDSIVSMKTPCQYSIINLFDVFNCIFGNILSNKSINNLFRQITPMELIQEGYSEYGNPCLDCLYEKSYTAKFQNTQFEIVFKRYFSSNIETGYCVDVKQNIRLISFLKYFLKQNLMPCNKPSFYFSDDYKEGAMIISNSIVVRFTHGRFYNQNSKRGNYFIKGIESGIVESWKIFLLKCIKDTMRPCDPILDATLSKPNSFHQLSSFLKNGTKNQ